MKLVNFFKPFFTPIFSPKPATAKQVVDETLSNVSSRYAKISTNELVHELQKQGFREPKIQKNKGSFHIVRMKWKNEIELNGDKFFPEIVIQNSFNGKHAFKVQMGIFRLVCSNGLTVSIKDFGSASIRHTGTATQIATQIVMEFAKNVPQAKQLLQAARPEDQGLGLWEVYNRVQENLLNGVVIEGVKSSRRAISAPQRYEKINNAVFETAFEFCN
jgi:hypothetical protein